MLDSIGLTTRLTQLRTRGESARAVCHGHSDVRALAQDGSALRSRAARAVPLHGLWDKETRVGRRARPPPQRRERPRTWAPSRRRRSWLAQAEAQGGPMLRRTPSRTVRPPGEAAAARRRRAPPGPHTHEAKH